MGTIKTCIVEIEGSEKNFRFELRDEDGEVSVAFPDDVPSDVSTELLLEAHLSGHVRSTLSNDDVRDVAGQMAEAIRRTTRWNLLYWDRAEGKWCFS